MNREPLSWQKGGRQYCGPLPPTLCPCGCGRTFDWGARHRKYWSTRCANRVSERRCRAHRRSRQWKVRHAQRGRRCVCGVTDRDAIWSNSLRECYACQQAARRNGRCPTHKRPYRQGGICPECRVDRPDLIPVIVLCEGRDEEKTVYRKVNRSGQISVGNKTFLHPPRDLVVTLPAEKFYRLRW